MRDYPIAIYALYLAGCLAATYALSQAVARDEADVPRRDDRAAADCALCGNPRQLTHVHAFVSNDKRYEVKRPVCAECADLGVAA